jgi:GNAT superfamily N-acetyltransferase
MKIRDAVPAEAAEACEVVRRSIIELCAADHHGDPAHLKRWLGNKTVENFAAWSGRRDHPLLVAVGAGDILAVGSVTQAGEITMNYVSPAARFRGVSSTLLAALETRAAAFGNRRCALRSSETAHRFYRSRGYTDIEMPAEQFGIAPGIPMVKGLGAAPMGHRPA